MKKNIVLATTLFLLGSMPAVFAEGASVEAKLSEATARIDSSRQSGKMKLKDAENLKKDATKLSEEISKARNKNNGALTKGDETKFCNRVKALDEKVSRIAYPNRTSDVEALAAVRKKIMAQKGLSTEAQNVKLSFEDGTLILDGQVKTDSEKEQLVNLAREAGCSNVQSKLTVVQ